MRKKNLKLKEGDFVISSDLSLICQVDSITRWGGWFSSEWSFRLKIIMSAKPTWLPVGSYINTFYEKDWEVYLEK